MITASYQPTLGETSLFFFKSLIKSRFLWGLSLLVFLVVFVTTLVEFVRLPANSGVMPEFIFFGATFAGLYDGLQTLLVLVVLSIALFFWRFWRTRKFLNKNITYTFDENRFTLETDQVKSEYKWGIIKKATQDKNYFYLSPIAPNQPNKVFIPKRAFAGEDLETFTDLLKAKNLLK